VLDIGCGYGSLTNYLRGRGLTATGIDLDEEGISRGRQLFPVLPDDALVVMSAERIGFPDASFDAVTLRDSLHHLYEEADASRCLDEIRRVLRPGGFLVIFDPQPNAVVRLCRRLVGHRDARCSARQAVELLRSRGWAVEQVTFTEAFALPLSGGYVGPVLVPPWPAMWRAILVANRAAAAACNAVGLGGSLLWRYLLTARRVG
jgi:SAM-dependent methyltransferase